MRETPRQRTAGRRRATGSPDALEPDEQRTLELLTAKLASDPELQRAASSASPGELARLVERQLAEALARTASAAQRLAQRMASDRAFAQLVADDCASQVQAAASRAEARPVEALVGTEESMALEHKATLRTSDTSGDVVKQLEAACLKTIAAFLNSREGGTLLIGVADDGTVTGLAADYASLHRAGKDDRDRFLLHLGDIMSQAMGEAATTQVAAEIIAIEGKDVCRVRVRPSAFPVEATVLVERHGQLLKEKGFFVRIGNATRQLGPEEKAKYIASRWPGSPRGGSL